MNHIELNDQCILELRRTRLHHWMRALEAIGRAQDKRCSRHTLQAWERQRREHILHLQALNSIFPPGDTADRDREHVARYGLLPGEPMA